MSAHVRVFLVGEGKNELGGRSGHPSYHDHQKRGVLEALLQKVRADGWVVGGAREWKSIRKFKARGPVDAETRNVIGAALDAREAQCHILAFCRDRDNDDRRWDAVEEGIRRVSELLMESPDIIGAVAIPKLEGWILALRAQPKTEAMSPRQAAEKLVALEVSAKDTVAMVRVVNEANLDDVPIDATSLHHWLRRAREVFARHTG